MNRNGNGVDLRGRGRERTKVGDLNGATPYSLEYERRALGSVFLAPNETMSEMVVRLSKAGPEVFYDLRNHALYGVLVEMFDNRIPIEVSSVAQELKDRQLFEQVGGVSYLERLCNESEGYMNIGHYLDVLLQKYALRRIVKVCSDVVAKVYDHEGDAEKLIEEVEQDIMQIRNFKSGSVQVTMRQAIDKAINTIEQYHARGGQLIGLPTGFMDLDKLTGGMMGGDVFVLAGRPSTGKTSMAMNIAERVSVEEKLPVGVFSLEMTHEQLVLRMLCSRSRVSLKNVRDGFMAQRDFPKLTMSAGKLSKAPIWIDDSNGLSIMALRAKARRMAMAYGIKLLIIDYLQLVKSSSENVDSRQQEIADVSAGVKSLAKELNIPVILLSQLNRELDRDKNRRPRLSDLRESGAIEQDADLVGILFKPKLNDEEPENKEAVPVTLWLGKQRNGPSDEDIHLTFLKSYTRFESAGKVSDEDVPVDAQGTF